ncbi:selenide, water dikinase SelD [Microvirga terricola]|uniref:Selenide, water dikinase n=1 Tax=Microvirga terricola TaxID=2719797 RepID=A0ABX0VCT0_9HYPH|nr:selenide, water dikinase SelD [Microvirga terricola]NIX77488.1 selenide, water dikinase SelD [Microvirga terricola]
MDMERFRLTHLAHGGGCGCKLAPSVLQQLLSEPSAVTPYRELLVGTETADDAAVWQLDQSTCIIATTDFFMPMVDDPCDFGRIAATNAISDVYAMGGRPIMALAILGMPLGKIAPEVVREILKGGASICGEAGIPVAGGHSIDCPEPVYGLVVIGTGHPDEIKRNSGARAGDALILTKALGVGIYSAAFKKDALSKGAYDEMIASVTLLNKVGMSLARDSDVHAITDVTGFGILGHGLEMARGSGLTLRFAFDALPLLHDARALAESGFVTGASNRNWTSHADSIRLPDDLALWKKNLLTDPQTSGGLLVSCAPERANDILQSIRDEGYPAAQIIGAVESGASVVEVQ